MFQLVYVSNDAASFTAPQLVTLLKTSRVNNTRLNITGMLLHQRGRFLQVLEGEESAVRSLAAKIGRDPRHHTVVTLHTSVIAQRDFPDWSMGFHDLENPDAAGVEGFSHLLQSSLSPSAFRSDLPAAKRMLLAFKNNLAA